MLLNIVFRACASENMPEIIAILSSIRELNAVIG
uniref:Uncharacterized protein n=1 Tax=Ralstonia solanacearum TaxID=305 RepID=A0A0S4TPI3_RALSL|nr:protein of unknown function [Ralstonia solanacearum]